MPESEPPLKETAPVSADLTALATSVSILQPVDDAAARLGSQLQNEIDQRREERFAWAFAMAMLLDCLIGQHLEWWLFLPVFLLQIVFLIGFAQWCGVDRVVELLNRIFDRYLPKKNEPSDTTGTD